MGGGYDHAHRAFEQKLMGNIDKLGTVLGKSSYNSINYFTYLQGCKVWEIQMRVIKFYP